MRSSSRASLIRSIRQPTTNVSSKDNFIIGLNDKFSERDQSFGFYFYFATRNLEPPPPVKQEATNFHSISIFVPP